MIRLTAVAWHCVASGEWVGHETTNAHADILHNINSIYVQRHTYTHITHVHTLHNADSINVHSSTPTADIHNCEQDSDTHRSAQSVRARYIRGCLAWCPATPRDHVPALHPRKRKQQQSNTHQRR
jgi:hypothetical protein